MRVSDSKWRAQCDGCGGMLATFATEVNPSIVMACDSREKIKTKALEAQWLFIIDACYCPKCRVEKEAK